MPGPRTLRKRRKSRRNTEPRPPCKGHEKGPGRCKAPRPFCFAMPCPVSDARKGGRRTPVPPSAGSCRVTSSVGWRPSRNAGCSSCQVGCSGIFWPCRIPFNTGYGADNPRTRPTVPRRQGTFGREPLRKCNTGRGPETPPVRPEPRPCPGPRSQVKLSPAESCELGALHRHRDRAHFSSARTVIHWGNPCLLRDE